MPRVCTACHSPHQLMIDSLLTEGRESKVQIGRLSGLSADAIGRHARHVQIRQRRLETEAADGFLTPRQQQLQRLMLRCDELFITAGTRNDLRGQIMSVREIARTLELSLRVSGELSMAAQTQNLQVNVRQGVGQEDFGNRLFSSLTVDDFDEIVKQAIAAGDAKRTPTPES